MTDESNQIYKRLGHLEKENASIVTSLESLTQSVNSLVVDVRGIKAGGKTNWGMLASWASVIIAVMVYHGNLTVSPLYKSIEHHIDLEGHPQALVQHEKATGRIKSNTKEVDMLRKNLTIHSKELGHPHLQTERVSQLEKRLEAILLDRFTDNEGQLMNKRIETLERRIP